MKKPTKYLKNTDDIIIELSCLRGMFAIMQYLIEEAANKTLGNIQGDFIDWFHGVEMRLCEIIEKIALGFDEKEGDA